jgi:L-ribulokinase
MQKKYAIGVDFGTLSGRAVLVELDTGNEIATAVKEYPHKRRMSILFTLDLVIV